MTADEVRARAATVAAAIGAIDGWRAELVAGTSAIGGGSAPGVELPTWLVSIARTGTTPDALEADLRRLTPPVITRIESDRVLLDPRTMAPDQDALLVALIRSARPEAAI
jgi:L-seryl-tRNA(Ser) seleniumtransferase